MDTKDRPQVPEIITVADLLRGCQCGNAYILGKVVAIRCVTCPIHGDPEFRKEHVK